jgi:hypothetical protein
LTPYENNIFVPTISDITPANANAPLTFLLLLNNLLFTYEINKPKRVNISITPAVKESTNQKRLISAEELSQNVWDFDSLPSDATLRSHIRTLRDIIGKEKILTVRGEGYIYE